jgi:citrate lyase subunit beta/citryl-CoA lyase
VPDQEKENAKKIIQTCNVNKKNTYIRINSSNDLSFVCDEKFIGIFLPFTESKEQLLSIDSQLKKIEKFKTDIIPIIESQKGLNNLQEICNFDERVKIISFGSHDLAKSINLKVSENEDEILKYRKLITKFSKKPIDTSYLNFKDIDGFKKSCEIVKDLGFGGKACIHPNQIEISNEIFNEK